MQLDLAREALASVGERWFILATLLPVAAILLATERLLNGRLPEVGRRLLHGFALLCAVGAGLAFAWKLLWLCDDAYISFRYARNFAEGHGLVFNVGEWVEGYTNFLWTLALGVFAKLGGSIEYGGLFGNLLTFVLALVFAAAAVRRASPGPTLIPFAAIALAGIRPFHTFASSGLETMPAAMLVVLAIWASMRRGGALWAGLLLTLAAMTRPDHGLFFGCMGLALVAEDLAFGEGTLLRRLDWKRYFLFAAPFVLIYLPYFFWRWNAYGDFYPNTYYAKSGNLAYWRQGFTYFGHFLATTGAVIWLPLFAWSLFGARRTRDEVRLRVFSLLSVLLYGTYVVKVGGDFMEHRFFVSLLPIVAVATEVSLRWRFAELRGAWKRAASSAFVAVGLVAALIPINVLKPGQKRWHLADEPTFYPLKSVFPPVPASHYAARGMKLKKVFVERGLSPAFAGDSIGMVGFFSELPIVDIFGLTNRRIAHKPIEKRGRPGHEKYATLQERLEEGAVIDVGNPWGARWDDATRARVDGFTFHFLRWDQDTIDGLREVKGARLPDPERDIERLAARGSRTELLEAVPFYSAFLDRHPEREALLARIHERLRSVDDFEEEQADEGVLRRVSARGRPGSSGLGMLASLPDRDSRVGSLEIPLGRIEHDELRFALGGRGEVRIELQVDGVVARTARPRDAKTLTPEAWDVREFQGREGVLRVIDEDAAPGAGLYLDAIHWAGGEDDVRVRLREGAEDPATLLRLAEAELPPDDPDFAPLLARFALRFDFEQGWPHGTDVDGGAFGYGPVSGKLAKQGEVSGFSGRRFVNSFHGGDRTVGKLALPPLQLDGQPIHLLVGGGADCRKTFVGLEVEGRIVARVCGRNDEVLRPAQLSTRRFAGKEGRVVAVDESTGGWGHILLDDVLVLQPAILPVDATTGERRGAVGSEK